ncbi:MAG: hypothetical protein HYS17_11460 [Micavibrio aeruginosavorus]|uniref:Uncharacterized protein n=1 Tax=Micavibrio aeruginosavorus TaxID=349221 RepID=A0A7T5R260_9BACT|nr:MAG: hypothetical protein HYS17_11460 [Micavibrio aeruginosavorus]
MSHNEQGAARSLFWVRLRENARSIVEREKADLQKKTVDPEYCLLPSDKDIMEGQQYMIGQMARDIERLKTDGCRSRALALYTVLTSRPSLLFK